MQWLLRVGSFDCQLNKIIKVSAYATLNKSLPTFCHVANCPLTDNVLAKTLFNIASYSSAQTVFENQINISRNKKLAIGGMFLVN